MDLQKIYTQELEQLIPFFDEINPKDIDQCKSIFQNLNIGYDIIYVIQKENDENDYIQLSRRISKKYKQFRKFIKIFCDYKHTIPRMMQVSPHQYYITYKGLPLFTIREKNIKNKFTNISYSSISIIANIEFYDNEVSFKKDFIIKEFLYYVFLNELVNNTRTVYELEQKLEHILYKFFI